MQDLRSHLARVAPPLLFGGTRLAAALLWTLLFAVAFALDRPETALRLRYRPPMLLLDDFAE